MFKGFPLIKQKKGLMISLVIFLTPAIWGFGCLVLKISPLGLCVEFESGKIPHNAQELFIKQVIEKTLEKDYQWLLTVSSETTAEELIALRPNIDENYVINKYREEYSDSGTSYHFSVRFKNNRKELYLILYGVWPSCVDFNITESEVFEHIELHHAAIWDY